jgi:hypothetical protein
VSSRLRSRIVIDHGARLFGVEVLHQLHGALDIREQRRDGLALALDGR